MQNYKVVGYEHRAGISKKTGKPYEIDIVHCVVEYPIEESGNGYGNRVEAVVYNSLINGPLEAVPAVGDYIDVCYSRSGFVTDIILSKV